MSRIAFHDSTSEHPADAPGRSSTFFDVTLVDGSTERVDDAHAYCQEQSMTTFFRNEGGRQAVDCWSIRVASFRTEHIVAIRRHERPLGEVRHLQPA
jgi:hypothetical protein